MGYVYKHIRLDTNEVFYIGVGSDTKYIRSKSKCRNNFWKNITNKTNYKVEIVLDNITEEEAYLKEIEYISIYGRKDLKTGTLCNLTNGGNGPITYKHSEEIKRKLSEINKKHNRNKGHIMPLHVKEALIKANLGNTIRKGILHTEESKLKMRLNSKRLKHSQETKDKIANSKLKLILDTSTGIYYNGAKEAAITLNYKESTLRSRLNGSLKNNTNLIYTAL